METSTQGTTAQVASRTGLPPGSSMPAAAQTAWFLGHPFSCMHWMRREFGDIYTVNSLNGPVVLGTTPAHAKQLFTADPDVFRTFATETLGAVLGDHSVLVTWGDPHRRQRKLLQPPFHGARMRAYARTMQEVAREHLAPLRRGQTLKVHDVTTAISLDVILRTVFGVAGARLDEGRAVLHGLLAGVTPLVLAEMFQRPWFPPWRKVMAQRERYNTLIAQLVAERRAKQEHGEDILGMLLDARWDDGNPMSTEEISDQLLTLLLAGHETTAIALAWAVHDLYQRPNLLARLRKEIATLGPTREPEAVVKLPFLSAVCDETLRRRPIVTDIIRTLRQPLDFGGYRLPAGVGIGVAIETIHADPTLYPDPDEFRPQRFVERKPGPFEFLPFGGGNRRCLGAAFSDQEARLVLAEVAMTLDMEVLGTDQRVRRNITMGPRRGVPVRVTGRHG